ncbi:MAG TPA: HEAT repeat domain-containing protein [Actinophytocola sp.]|uniref:HEAT repeat domain-containing protein n=1 Tax=Actinophytocola sp. TaxID=1872138 RepID=UPI002DB5771E|nr:HEAT repeat domain-containing protein [Actinophytocola sp.]HEU5474258.1 HEAT repeat domain-containing protein [Actinophytocola sp.]
MSWSAWIPLGSPPGGVVGRPAISSRETGTNVYVRGSDNALWQLGSANGQWHGWDRHDDGLVLASSPAVGSMGPDHEIVFAAGTDGTLWGKGWTSGAGWSPWGSLGTTATGFVGDPVAICRNPKVCHVYLRGGDNFLWQLVWFHGAWYWGRHEDGALLAADPAAASSGPDHEIVFVVGLGGHVWSKEFSSGTGWSDWNSLGSPNGDAVDGLCAVSRHPTVVDLYARGADKALWQREYRNGSWHGWYRHEDGAALGSGPAAATRGPEHELVVHRGPAAQLFLKWWEPNLRTVDVNLIRVGLDCLFPPIGPESTLALARWICFQAGLDVRAVRQFRIGPGAAAAWEIIDGPAEAEELADRWSMRGSALDVFVVRAVNVPDGAATVWSDRDVDPPGGGVFSLNGTTGVEHTCGPNPIVCGWQAGTGRGTALATRFGASAPGAIRHPVAALLTGRAESAAIDSLDRAALDELRAIAGGAAHPHYRLRAMSLLAAAKPDDGRQLFRAALRDECADVTVRAAAATWLSRFAGPQAQAALLAALASERSVPVLHKIIAGLARVGEEDVIPVLSELADTDPNLAGPAAFARSVIAHRVGLGGCAPPAAGESRLAPAPAGAPRSPVLESYEQIPNAARLPQDTYGMIVGPGIAGLRCGGRRLAVAIDLTALARLLTTPTIPALVASRAEFDGSLHTSMLVLSWPANDNTAHLAVHRLAGTPAYVGSAKVAGSSVSFELTAVHTPGARHTSITGAIVSGVLQDLDVRSGPRLPAQIPEPI